MLAELAAANAAFSIIKQTLANGKELASAGKAIAQFVNAEEELQSRGNRKKNSFWRKVGGSAGDDLEEFMALEEVRNKKKELEQAMIYYGRPGLHGDWVRFQAEARKRRQDEAVERKRKREQTLEIILITGLCVLAGSIVLYFLWLLTIAVRSQ
jgi:hypothetical protein